MSYGRLKYIPPAKPDKVYTKEKKEAILASIERRRKEGSPEKMDPRAIFIVIAMVIVIAGGFLLAVKNGLIQF